MPNKRIDQLPASTNNLQGTDKIPVFSDNRTERFTIDELASYSGFTSDTTPTSTSPWTGGTGNNSIVDIGSSSVATGTTSLSFGINAKAYGNDSIALGRYTKASGEYSFAEGFNTTASGNNSHAEGEDSVASGDDSHVEGYSNMASGRYSHSEGYQTTASGQHSHAQGQNSSATGYTSHSEGYYTRAYGSYSHSEGWETTSRGTASHAEGYDTTASGNQSHAQGYNTTASGLYSHAGGSSSTASGNTSFIHSTNSSVNGDRSVVLGGQNITGTADDTVYVPKLNINDVGNGTPITNLGIDSRGNVVSGSTIPSYKIFTAIINDFGTPTEPSMTILENTLGVTPTISYEGVGDFRINATEVFTLGYTTAVFGPLQGANYIFKQGAPSADYVNWSTGAEQQMLNMAVEIKVFTP
jgi:hypothetical protein